MPYSPFWKKNKGDRRSCGLLLVKVPTTSTAKEEEHKVDPNLDVSKWNEEVTRVVCALAAAAGKCWKMLGEVLFELRLESSCPSSGCYFKGLL